MVGRGGIYRIFGARGIYAGGGIYGILGVYIKVAPPVYTDLFCSAGGVYMGFWGYI